MTEAEQATEKKEVVREQIRSLSVEQMNSLHDKLYSVKCMLDAVNADELKDLTAGKISLPAIEKIMPLLAEVEKVSQESIFANQVVRDLVANVRISDLLEEIKKVLSESGTHEDENIDDLLAF